MRNVTVLIERLERKLGDIERLQDLLESTTEDLQADLLVLKADIGLPGQPELPANKPQGVTPDQLSSNITARG